MQLSVRTWVTFVVLAVAMSLINIYSTLLTGWGDGGSISAAILCAMLLSRREGTVINYNLGQTMASAGGSVGFATTLLAAVYVLKPDWNPPLIELGLLVMSVSLLGVLLAVPLRPFIVNWFFPTAVAVGTLLMSITSTDPAKRQRAFKVLGISGGVSALCTFPTKVASEAGAEKAVLSGISFGKFSAISLDPLLYGVGLIIGPRIGISLLAGAGLGLAFVAQLEVAGVPKVGIGDYVKWAAVGFMTLPAFSSMLFASLFKNETKLPPIFADLGPPKEVTYSRSELLFLGAVALFAIILTSVMMQRIFEVNALYVSLSLAMGAPLCVMLGKVASETDINPVRLLSIVLLAVLSLISSFGAVALLGLAIFGGAIASVAVDLFYDLRTGRLVGANPKHQVKVQMMGVAVTAIITVAFLHYLAVNYGFGEGKYFPAPGAVIWAKMAEAFATGGSNFTSGIWWTLWTTSILGVVMSFFANWPPTRTFAPSAFAIGIALLLPFDMAPAICIGSLVRFAIMRSARKKGEGVAGQRLDDVYQGGSAVFAAAALMGIVVLGLAATGVVHLPGH